MLRRELGFVVSRAMSVLVLMQALQQMAAAWALFPMSAAFDRNPIIPWQIYVHILALLALAFVLWQKADRFGGVKEPASTTTLGIPTSELRRSLFAVLGAYLVVSGGVGLLNTIWEQIATNHVAPEQFRRKADYLPPVATLAIGLMVVLMNGPRPDSESDR